VSRRAPVPAESFTGTAAEVQCPTCGELERHQPMNFFRADPTIPIQPGEVIQVQAICAKRASRLHEYWAGGAQSYFIQLPKESK
jgi:hypothetical protein